MPLKVWFQTRAAKVSKWLNKLTRLGAKGNNGGDQHQVVESIQTSPDNDGKDAVVAPPPLPSENPGLTLASTESTKPPQSVKEHQRTLQNDGQTNADTENKVLDASIEKSVKPSPPPLIIPVSGQSPRHSFSSVGHRNQVAEQFEQGVMVSDEWHRIRKYPSVFIGRDAVTFLVQSQLAHSRQEAVDIGNNLMKHLNLFEHVHRDHEFKDEYLFYRFVKKRDRFITVQDEIAALTLLGDALYLGENDQESSSSTRRSTIIRSLTETSKMFEEAVRIGDHKYLFRNYPKTFVGSEAVDILVSHGLAYSRQDAVALGRRMQNEINLFAHVTRQHEFKDDYLFYRFQPPSTRRTSLATLVANSERDATHNDTNHEGNETPSWLERVAMVLENGGVSIQDRRHRMKVYPQTFVASEAVDFLVKQGYSNSRAEAVQVGLDLMEKLNLFTHVGHRSFSDDYLFFHFTAKEYRKQPSSSLTNTTKLFHMADLIRKGVNVGNNRYRLKTYPKTVVGSEVVDFLVNSSLAQSRRDAVQLGRTLDMFEHATGEHEFKDDYLFYRFKRPDLRQESSTLSTGSYESSIVPPEKMAEALRSGVQVLDRHYHLKLYKNVFLGNEAVDFLVDANYAETRDEAVDLGRSLAREFDLFLHCTRDHELEDKPLFYEFVNLGEIRPLSTSALALSTAELREIGKALEENLEVKTNRHHLRVYHNTFVASEAVDWLVQSGKASSRQEAVLIGRALVEQFNLIEHVSRDHFFGDQKLFFRFVAESMRQSWLEDGDSSDVLVSIPKFGVVTTDDEWRRRVEAFETKMISKTNLHRALSKKSESDNNLMDPVNRLKGWAREFRRSDPRYQILNYFHDVAQEGADKVEESGINPDLLRPLLRYFSRASVFTVWRPTSYDAIRKMILGEAVGKGLDIKGKSAKRGKLSGYVPFLQISLNKHKDKIRPLPRHGSIRLFFPENGRRARDVAAMKLEAVAHEMIECIEEAKRVLADDSSPADERRDAMACMLLEMADPSISYIEDYAPKCYGLEIPVRLFWETYYTRQDISREPGSEYDTGRPSQPAFQDMNFASLRNIPKDDSPRAVLYSYQCSGQEDPISPFNILMAYEENGRVLPVVSDFDCFLVGTRGVSFSAPLSPHQLDVLKWCVDKTEHILDGPQECSNWTSRWLTVLKEANKNGFHPKIPRFGFGDPKTYSLMEHAIGRLRRQGAVRHGAECFNFYFPQELDDEFLVVSENLPGQTLPWQYVDVGGLQQILRDKIDEGYTFPLNPKWILCDSGWKDIYDKLMRSEKANVQDSLRVWYPHDSGVREQIESIHLKHPDGFQRHAKGEKARMSGTGMMDLALARLKHRDSGAQGEKSIQEET